MFLLFFQAENFRVKEMLQKEKGTDRLSLNKAAIKHKLDLLEGRLNYWKEFHRKLQREERKAFQALGQDRTNAALRNSKISLIKSFLRNFDL